MCFAHHGLDTLAYRDPGTVGQFCFALSLGAASGMWCIHPDVFVGQLYIWRRLSSLSSLGASTFSWVWVWLRRSLRLYLWIAVAELRRSIVAMQKRACNFGAMWERVDAEDIYMTTSIAR